MSESTQPSIFSRFMKGAWSSMLSGALMAAVVATVGTIFGMGMPPFLGLVACTTVFGGIMAVIKGGGENRSANTELTTAEVATPVISQSLGHAPSISADLAEDASPSRADGKSWAETAGRSASSRSAIDSILAKGNMTDSDRASAILAAREQAPAPEAAR